MIQFICKDRSGRIFANKGGFNEAFELTKARITHWTVIEKEFKGIRAKKYKRGKKKFSTSTDLKSSTKRMFKFNVDSIAGGKWGSAPIGDALSKEKGEILHNSSDLVAIKDYKRRT